MRLPPTAFAVLLLAGCNLVSDARIGRAYDPDGDGVAWPEDCDSSDARRYPGATEVWYDGVDGDCAGDDDYDADRDGFVPAGFEGLETVGAHGSGALPGGDCWDDPATVPGDFTVPPASLTDAAGTPLAWVQPAAAEVHPEAEDPWYDGVDQDCDGADDLDQDGDGWRTAAYPDRDGVFGPDCMDGSPLDDPDPAGIGAAGVNPGAGETWYDGTDQDCDGEDCDQDGDGEEADPEALGFCEQRDCDDTDPDVGSGGGFDEVWYDGVDQDCDGDDGDQDGDGFWVADYEARVRAAGGDPLPIPAGSDGDCWDDPASVPDDFSALNGMDQPDADEVFPEATDAWYDGVDQDCAGDDDFDQDGDGAATDALPDRDGALGGDCDDLDADVGPSALEIWYDGEDPNCDGNDGDQDGDGAWADDYEARVDASGGTPMAIPAGQEGDCDDLDATVHPGAEEWCDGQDTDCDGVADDEDARDAGTWYGDADGDGMGDPAAATVACTQPGGTVADASDCDDGDAAVHPGAAEVCDGVDDDCDGLVDQLDPSVVGAATYVPDADGDGYGDQAHAGAIWCPGDEPAGWLTDASDCDDADARAHPGAAEVCNGVDDDCDGAADEDDALDAATWCRDADGDGWGDAAFTDVACIQPAGYVAAGGDADCDDGAAAIHPGAAERAADGVDQDCDGVEDCYVDADGDGYGIAATATGGDLDCSDAGEATVATDCDDGLGFVHPGATEVAADGLDNDCDGFETCFRDLDGDGWGTAVTVASADPSCTLAGTSTLSTDCDDAAPASHPGAAEIVADGLDNDCDGIELCFPDADGDGFGRGAVIPSADLDCSDAGEASSGTDCDDGDARRSPALPEVVADGLDNDCDGYETCYRDLDRDGWGTATTVPSADTDCGDAGESTADTDCDDGRAGSHPGAVEWCDGYDDDCDGTVDEDEAVDVRTWYADADGDGFGLAGSADVACTAPAGFVADATDCDDGDPGDHPGATEVCDGDDDDCDGAADESDAADAGTWYPDGDGDGWGAASGATRACSAPAGFVADGSDCDDGTAGTNPGATEVCNEVDDDCDGVVDGSGAVGEATWYLDADGDAWGVASTTLVACFQPAGYAAAWGDCDDGTASTNPGAAEVCGNGADDDCDGTAAGCTPLGDLALADAEARLLGEADGDQAGNAACGADFDGDGLVDIAVGSRGNDGGGTSAGSAYLALGSIAGDLALGSADTVLRGAAAGDFAGSAVAGLPDLDGDGYGSVVVGAYGNDATALGAGVAYVVPGSERGTVSLGAGFPRLLGVAAGDAAGWSLAGSGDVGGDGLADLLVGAYGCDAAGTDAGAAYLVSGPVTGDLGLGSATARLLGETAGARAGYAVAAAGDVDGDGLADLLVGAPYQDRTTTGAGAAYLVCGPVSGDLALGGADARLVGASGDYAGWSVAGAGDVDGDGTPDLLVGAPQNDVAATNAGAAYLVLGPVTGSLSLAASAGARLLGVAAGDLGGTSVAGGDVDGDGLSDLLVGAPYASGAMSASGAAALALGPVSGDLSLADADAVLWGEGADDLAGNVVAVPGDVSGDGFEEILVVAGAAAGGGTERGAAYLVLGGGL